jgi:hypothetical protein
MQLHVISDSSSRRRCMRSLCVRPLARSLPSQRATSPPLLPSLLLPAKPAANMEIKWDSLTNGFLC